MLEKDQADFQVMLDIAAANRAGRYEREASAKAAERQARAGNDIAQTQENARRKYLEQHPGPHMKNINGTIEGVQVDYLRSLNNGLVDAIMGTRKLGDVFAQVAKQIIADLLRIQLRRALIGPLAEGLFGGGSNNLLAGAARQWRAGSHGPALSGGRARAGDHGASRQFTSSDA